MIKQMVHASFKRMKESGKIHNPNYVHLLKNFLFEGDGSLVAFPTLKKLIDLENPHSVFKIDNSSFLVCSNVQGVDKLYRYDLQTNSLSFITDLWLSYNKLCYVKVRDNVFMSNRHGKLIYNITSSTVKNWLPAERVPFSDVEEASDYALTDVVEFPNCERLVSFLGRIWGSVDNVLWFTDAIFCTHTRATNFIEFGNNIIGLSASPSSILVLLPNSFYLGYFDERTLVAFKQYSIDGIIPDSAVCYKDEFIFLCKEGIVYVKEGSFSIINKEFVRIILSGTANTSRIGEGEYLIGGEGFKLNFRDNIDAEIIRLNK